MWSQSPLTSGWKGPGIDHPHIAWVSLGWVWLGYIFFWVHDKSSHIDSGDIAIDIVIK